MICKKTCTLAAAFLGASLATSYFVDKTNLSKDFKDSLSKEKKHIYEEITKERKNLYFTGLSVGLALSILLILLNKNNPKSIYNLNKNQLVCATLATTFTVCYFFYILAPKSTHMVLHLDTKHQKELWLKIYKKMQFNYHAGFVLGLVGVSILAYGVC